jgi:hypothetical protein
MTVLRKGEQVAISTMTPERLRNERSVSGISLIPTNLILRCRPSETDSSKIHDALAKELGDISRVKIAQYGVDQTPYYEAYYAAGATQYSPITVVKVWYYF